MGNNLMFYALRQNFKYICNPVGDNTHPRLSHELIKMPQLIWAIRNNPEFLAYHDGEEVKVADAIGLELPEGTIFPNEAESEFNAEFRNYRFPNIELPGIQEKTKRGLLTDAVLAFRNKLMNVPYRTANKENAEAFAKYGDRVEPCRLKGFEGLFEVYPTKSLRPLNNAAIKFYTWGGIANHADYEGLNAYSSNIAQLVEPKEGDVLGEKYAIPVIANKKAELSELVRVFAPQRIERFNRALG